MCENSGALKYLWSFLLDIAMYARFHMCLLTRECVSGLVGVMERFNTLFGMIYPQPGFNSLINNILNTYWSFMMLEKNNPVAEWAMWICTTCFQCFVGFVDICTNLFQMAYLKLTLVILTSLSSLLCIIWKNMILLILLSVPHLFKHFIHFFLCLFLPLLSGIFPT